MTRNDVGFEKKYRYLLYRIQQALIEMEAEPRQHRGRRHLENGLYTCEGFISTQSNLVTHEEMTAIKKEIFALPSMGCRVDSSQCSVCGKEFPCEHMEPGKMYFIGEPQFMGRLSFDRIDKEIT